MFQVDDEILWFVCMVDQVFLELQLVEDWQVDKCLVVDLDQVFELYVVYFLFGVCDR